MSNSDINVAVTKLQKTKKVSYSLETDVVEQFNKIAKNKNYNKSQTVNNLIKLFIKKEMNIA